MCMKRPSLARVAVGVALAAWLGGCKKGTLGDPDAGGAGQIMGAGARGASGIGGAGASAGGIGGGSVGRGGSSGGRGMVSCPPPGPPYCGAAACGNGRIDSCNAALAPECFPIALREECDGDAFDGADCAANGFPAGKLVCDKTCSVSSAGCSECMPMVPWLINCGTIPPMAASVGSYAIAATDSEVGLAEVGYGDLGGMTLSFRRLTPSLDTASNMTLLDTLRPGPLQGAYVEGGVAVAPLPSGWVIAGCVSGQLLLFTVDAAGMNSVRAPTPVGARGCAYAMVLAAQPGAGPLLVWSEEYIVRGALIAADGQLAGTPFDIAGPPEGSNAGMFDAAWVGDAFNVAVAVFAPDYNRGLRIARIDPNGTLTSRDLLIGEFEEAPRIARGATDTRVTYVARSDRPPGNIENKWRRLGSAGELLAEAVLVTPVYNYTSIPAVAFGDDTLVLLDPDGNQSSLAVARVGPDGQIPTRPYDILRAPLYYIIYPDMVRRGPDAIVSWISNANSIPRVGLVRITP